LGALVSELPSRAASARTCSCPSRSDWISPLLLELADLRLVARQPRPDRLEQCLDPRLVLLFGLGKALLRALEQHLLRLPEDLRPRRLEFGLEAGLSLDQAGLLLIEVGGVGAQRRQFDRGLAQFRRGPAEALLRCPRLTLVLGNPRAQFRRRARTREPAKRYPAKQAKNQRD
jgi:hypothetical protein